MAWWRPFASAREAKVYLARTFDLSLEPQRLLFRRALVGRIAGHDVAIWAGFGLPVRASIDTHGAIPADLSIRTAGLFERSDKYHTGDRNFDVGVDVFGDPIEAAALFDAETRRLAEGLAEAGVVVTMGRVELFDSTRSVDDLQSANRFARVFRDMLDLAKRLTTGRELNARARLQRIAQQDPSRGVRTQALRTLVKYYPWSEEARAASLAVSPRARLDVRLFAAKHLATLRPPIWEPLAKLCYEPTLSDRSRISALTRLFQVTPTDVAHRLLRAATRSPTLRADALHTAVSARLAPGEALIEEMLAEGEPRLSIATIRAIATFGYVDFVPRLTPLVAPDQPGVAIAAAQALGLLGGLDAVERLHQISNRFLVDAKLRHAVRTAIAQIQARCGGGAGQLSITAGEEGRLAVAAEVGRVAVAEED